MSPGPRTNGDEEQIPTIVLPRAKPHQIPIIEDQNRFKVICAGRRWGKTILGLLCVVQGHGNGKYIGAAQGGNIWWVAPTYPIANVIWRDLKKALKGAAIKISEVERRVDLPGGGSITVRSTDNPDSLRGAGLDGIVIDEAAFVKEEAWAESLRPALADRQGWAIFISTPDGRNWFWKLWARASIRDNYANWQRPTSDNPLIPPTELEEAKLDMGPMVFAQEHLAEFIAAGANQFRTEWFVYAHEEGHGVYRLEWPLDTGDIEVEYWASKDLFIFAILDLATTIKQDADYTVATTCAITPKNQLIILEVDRRRLEGPDHIAFINNVYQRWHPHIIGIERGGFQQSVVQAAVRQGLPIKPLYSDKDKVARAQTILARYSQRQVFHMANASWLEALELELSDFPNGEHDDQVDTLSYAGILLAERPSRRMLFTDSEKLITSFNLDSQMTSTAQMDRINSVLPGGERQSDDLLADKSLRDDFEWRCALGKDVETILSAVNPQFMTSNGAMWHAHLAVQNGGYVAAISLARISEWQLRVNAVENSVVETEVPKFEVPLVLRIMAPSVGHLDLNILADFVVTLRQVRGFNITSASVSGFNSASIIQKLVRAGIAASGALINSDTGLPYGPGQPISVDRQPYTDLQLATQEGRVSIMNNGWAAFELLQLEETGDSISGMKETSDAVAGAVGYLARWGHMQLDRAEDDLVSFDELGVSRYSGFLSGKQTYEFGSPYDLGFE